jgi:hypothetical protein
MPAEAESVTGDRTAKNEAALSWHCPLYAKLGYLPKSVRRIR